MCGASLEITGQFQTEDWINRVVLATVSKWLAKVCAQEGDEGAIVQILLIQEIPVKFNLADLIRGISRKPRQQFQ